MIKEQVEKQEWD